MALVGTLTRDPADSFPVALDFSLVDVFAASAVTTATATVTAASAGVAGDLVLGGVSVASNKATFNVSGGAAGARYVVTVRATNALSNVVERSIAVETADL